MACSRRSIRIGSVAVGSGEKPLFLPDIDVYFKRDLDFAFTLIDRLADSGCKFIKLAALHDPEICLSGHTTCYWVHDKGYVEEDYRTVLDRHVVGLDDLQKIVDRIRKRGLALALSVYDAAGIKFGIFNECELYKIPSSNIVHAPLIRDLVLAGKPIILDTGRSTISEVAKAVSWLRATDETHPVPVIIQHSPAGPPTPTADANLQMMLTLGRDMNSYYGLSDHASDDCAMLAAAALDADVIETGVADLSRGADIDTAHALDITGVAALIKKIEIVHCAAQAVHPPREAAYPPPKDRMGLVARRHLYAGEVLTIEMVRFAFPAIGIGVEDVDQYLGSKLVEDVETDTPIFTNVVEPL